MTEPQIVFNDGGGQLIEIETMSWRDMLPTCPRGDGP
jgi:hypothetical protein